MTRHHSARIAKLEARRGLIACGADRVSVILVQAAMPDDLHEGAVTGRTTILAYAYERVGGGDCHA